MKMRAALAGKIRFTTREKPKEGVREIKMSEPRSFWQRLFGRTGTSSLSQRQKNVLEYILNRMDAGVPLQEVLQEEQVRRTCSRAEVEQIMSNPEFIEAARERLGESFRSEEFKL